MTATRLSKLLIKALRTDPQTILSVPLNFTKLVGQTADTIQFRDTDDTTVLFGVDADGVVTSAGGVTNPADNSVALAKLVRGTDGQLPIGQTGAALAYKAMSGDATIDKDGAIALAATLIKYATVSITAANIVATTAGALGHADGVVLVASPGGGKCLELISAVVSYTRTTATYGAGGNLTINLAGGIALTGVAAAATSLGAGASNINVFNPLAATSTILTAATGLNLVAATAFTNPGTAAGTVKVFVTYRVHTL